MDPASLGVVVGELAPVLAALIFAALPVGIIYVLKSHKVRMRELDLEAQMLPRSAEARLAAIEARLAVGAARPGLSEQRAALLEGPATTAAEPAPLVRARER